MFGYTINIQLISAARKNTNASRRWRVKILAPTRRSMLITLTSKIVVDSIARFISTVAIPRKVRIPNHTRATLARRCDISLILANPRRRNTEIPTRNNIPILSAHPAQKPNNPSKNEIIQNHTREAIAIRS